MGGGGGSYEHVNDNNNLPKITEIQKIHKPDKNGGINVFVCVCARYINI